MSAAAEHPRGVPSKAQTSLLAPCRALCGPAVQHCAALAVIDHIADEQHVVRAWEPWRIPKLAERACRSNIAVLRSCATGAQVLPDVLAHANTPQRCSALLQGCCTVRTWYWQCLCRSFSLCEPSSLMCWRPSSEFERAWEAAVRDKVNLPPPGRLLDGAPPPQGGAMGCT